MRWVFVQDVAGQGRTGSANMRFISSTVNHTSGDQRRIQGVGNAGRGRVTVSRFDDFELSIRLGGVI